MDNETTRRRFESVFSTKVRAGKRRTYFFDVRRTKGDDYYVTLTESTKKYNGDGYERHKIFLYKEDFNRFLASLTEAIDHVKTELMPDYDYDEFTKKQQEWEARRAAENAASDGSTEKVTASDNETEKSDDAAEESVATDESEETEEDVSTPVESDGDDDDISW